MLKERIFQTLKKNLSLARALGNRQQFFNLRSRIRNGTNTQLFQPPVQLVNELGSFSWDGLMSANQWTLTLHILYRLKNNRVYEMRLLST